MTQLRRYPFGFDLFHDFFNTPTLTRKVQTLDNKVLANKENYSIWELPNGKYEVRVSFTDDNSYYHRETVRQTLEEAEEYVDNQVAYHLGKIPRMVKSYKKD